MANEITVSGSLSVAKGNLGAESLAISTFRATMAGNKVTKAVQSIPTTAGGTAIKLGDLASAGYYIMKNLDPTNYVELLDSVSGTKFGQIDPGGFALGKFSSNVTAPAAISHTAACLLEYEICEL